MLQHSRWWLRWSAKGWMNYIWLAYVPFNLLPYLPAKTSQDWLWLSLGIIFIATYVAVIELPRYRSFYIALELVVCAWFSLRASNNYMMIFPAWQVAFLFAQTNHGRQRFRGFVVVYELIIVASLIRSGLVVSSGIYWQDPSVVAAIFPLVSPFMAYFLARQMYINQTLQQTNRRLEAVILRDERERIARDLHDTLGQSFSLITLKAELASKLMTKAPERVLGELADIQATSRQNLQLVRDIVNDLHRQSISELLIGQSSALRTTGVALMTVGEAEAEQWPMTIQPTIAAVLQEALTNVIRHAHADKVTIEFDESVDLYAVTIQDDGDGMRYERPGSNGITGMQQRVLALGGSLTIRRNRIGTQVTCHLSEGNES